MIVSGSTCMRYPPVADDEPSRIANGRIAVQAMLF